MEKLSMTDIRKMNYRDIYHLIYREQRISKSQIASTLQMSLPTVTQHLASLEEEGLIGKQGQLDSEIGRKAAAYAIRASARVAVGVEILPGRVTVVVIDLYGSVLAEKERPLLFSQEGAYFEALANLIRDVLKAANVADSAVLGVGLGVQGLVSVDGRELLFGKLLNCMCLTAAPLEALLAFPVRFVQDVECAAELELWRRPELTEAVYLSIGTCLGGAIISDGRVRRGSTGRSGTFGHMTLKDGGRECYCGKRGCAEGYCSIGALLESEESLKDFFSALRSGSARHRERWAEYIRWLSLMLSNIHMTIDSEIILGGRLTRYLRQEDLDRIFAAIRDRTAFPEGENFLRLSIRAPHLVSTGSAIPLIRSFLSSI